MQGELELSNIDYRGQTHSVWRKQRILILLFFATVVGDYFSTVGFMSLTGIEKEMNPLIHYLSTHIGIYWGPFIGKCAQVVAAWGFCMIAFRLAAFVIAMLTFFNFAAVIINTNVVIQALAVP